ncbi:MAG: hypothetical protein IKD77_01155 [Bacilli bacterium]|nr:hypothetical protein [Bacilli bacterium]
MEKIVFKDSRAIKITPEMRGSLDLYNQKKQELEKANENLALLDNSRKDKEKELETLNIKSLDSDKKSAKEASKKIKTIDKEINKIQNDIEKANDTINKILEQNKNISMPGVNIKSFKEFGTAVEPSVSNENISVDNQIIDNDINIPEIKIDIPDVEAEQTQVNEPVIPDVSSINDIEQTLPEIETPIINNISEEEPVINNPIENDSAEETNDNSISDEPSVEPIVLENDESEDNVEIVDETDKSESSSEEENNPDDDIIVNPFLSQEGIDKMWNELNDEMKDTDSKEEEPVVKKEKPIKTQNAKEIEKPDIFGNHSKFAKIADKVVSPSPLIPKGESIDLVPYNDYNDYVFKFGQDHYGKEALTPKEISDLSDIKNFLDGDTFELERSKQYNNVLQENDELKNRITKLDEDYKHQLKDMRDEHFSNLDKLGNLIDKANDIISDNRNVISDLEGKNENLNNIIVNQTETIDSLNKKKSDLENTIDRLKNDIEKLEKIKEEHEEKIENYESKFKEVLGIVREVKTDN